MKFTAALLSLPVVALAQTTLVTSTTTTSAPAASGTPDYTICDEQAGGYTRYCPRCEYLCEDRTGDSYSQCLYSVFFTINYYDSQCQAHSGSNCADQAVNTVCGSS